VLIHLLSVLVSAGGLALSIEFFKLNSFAALHRISWFVYWAFIPYAIVNIVIPATFCITLWKLRKGTHLKNGMISRLVVCSANTGAITSLLAVASLVTFTTMPSSLVFLAIHLISPKLSFISLLVMLNSREHGLFEQPSGGPSKTPIFLTTAIRVPDIEGTDEPNSLSLNIRRTLYPPVASDKMHDVSAPSLL